MRHYRPGGRKGAIVNTKWTPGPWKVDEVWALIEGPNGEEVAAVHAATTTQSQRASRNIAQANARLIAAAPELVKALAACLYRLEHYTADTETCDLVPLDERAINAARALLAKLDLAPTETHGKP